MEILKIEGLCKQYPAFSLKNVSFSMESGTVMGFIGRNGAGKTTTLKSMLRLVHPDAGHVELCGMDVATQELAVKAQIGFVTGSAAYYPRKRLGQLTAATRRFGAMEQAALSRGAQLETLTRPELLQLWNEQRHTMNTNRKEEQL